MVVVSTQDVDDSSKSGSFRYIILVVTIICLSSVMANVVCFNFTVLCMPGNGELDELSNNKTQFDGYTQNEKTWLFSAMAFGALIGVFPTTYGISKWGGRVVFSAAGVLTAVSTMLIPTLAADYRVFLALRFLQGFSFASLMPTVGNVTSSWASLTQQGLFIGALTTFGTVSTIFSMPVAGQLCVSPFGWKSVFYLHAFISIVVFAVWFIIFTDSPADNRYVSKEELRIIQQNKSDEENARNQDRVTTPFREIITTPSIWGVWIGAFGDMMAHQFIHIYSPMYIHDIGGYSVENTGFAAALPFFIQFFVRLSTGHLSDRMTCVTETVKLRIFNTIASGISALFFIALGIVGRGHGLLGLTLITLATGVFGFDGGGFIKCAALISRQHSHFVMANLQLLVCTSMLVCPILVSFFLGEGSVENWHLVFFLHSGMLMVTNSVFCWFATARPAPWTDRKIVSSSSKNIPLYRVK